MVVEESDYEKDVKFRNHFVFNFAKNAGKYENHMEKLKSVTESFKIEPKGCWKGAKGRHNLTKGRQKGAEGSQKRAKREPKGTKREPKASQREPKASQRTTKMPKQIYAGKKVPKRSDRGDENHWNSLEKQLFLMIWKGRFGTKRASHFQFPGLPKPQLFARLLSQGTCRYTYPMR